MADIAWSDVNPPGSEDVGQGENRMQEDRKAVRERWVQGGHWMTDTAVETFTANGEGLHRVGTGPARGSPLPATGGPHIYKSTGTDPNWDLLIEYTNTGAIMDSGVDPATGGWRGPNVTSGDDPGHRHTGTYLLVVPGALSTGRLLQAFRIPDRGTVTDIVKVSITTMAAIPVAGDHLIVDIFVDVNPTPTTVRTSSGVSIFDDAPGGGVKPTILTGSSTTYNETTTFTASNVHLAMPAGTEIFAVIDQADGGFSDLSIQIDFAV